MAAPGAGPAGAALLGGGVGGGVGGGGAPAGPAVFDVSDAEFATKVLDASRDRPVIVDFWAPWCGPCKQLGPVLEQAVAATNGKVALAKIDIDQNPMVAQQLRIQSIPAVFAFVNGQPVDGFMGAVRPAEIQEFIDRLVRGSGAGAGVAEMLDQAEAAMREGAVAEAAQVFAAVFQHDPTEMRALAGLARAYAASGDVERARQTLQMAPVDKAADAAIVGARTAIDLAEETAGAAQKLAQSRAAVAANADDHAARYDLALALVAIGEREEAVSELLELFRRDRDWNDEAAKKQLMKLFDAFGPTDPITLTGRRRLSSMIFA